MRSWAHSPESRPSWRAKGVPEGVIEVGATLPDAELIDPHGATTTLYEALGDRVAVLVFYRGAWCPYCNIDPEHLPG